MKNSIFICLLLLFSTLVSSQPCVTSGITTLSKNPHTYYPGHQTTVSAGATTIFVGAADFGTTPISAGDLVFIIQMQGAEINSTNTDQYGDGVSGGNANGYLNNSNHLAGNMEYAIAKNSVSLSGGTLELTTGTTRSYRNTGFGAAGQYRYQVIRVPVYYNAQLSANISAPAWNGRTGGVIIIHVRNDFGFGGYTIDASGRGFRGGAARQLWGDNHSAKSFVSSATLNVNASKGEGTAGTPRYVNSNGVLVDNGFSSEGYPGGSIARGAPGNAGGGGTDGDPASNQENSGGAGGGNGGAGGRGGKTWFSELSLGGEPGAVFAQRVASRIVMGGGGGAGTTNNGTGNAANGFSSSGAAGGGIVILNAGKITSAGFIKSNGAAADGSIKNDGSGGGGAGGSILVIVGTGHNNITAQANGGHGGSNSGDGTEHGPGGGGGGGVIYSGAALNAASTVTGGLAGYTVTSGNNFGAVNGSNGELITNTTQFQFPVVRNPCSTLPAKLIAFTYNETNSGLLLQWKVTNEENVKEYVLERSSDGTSFGYVGNVTASLSIEAEKNYSYTDNNIRSAVIYYRLKTVDIDGKFSYSEILLYRAAKKEENTLSIFPNPVVNSKASILLPYSLINKQITVKITASDGRVIMQQQLTPASNLIKFSIPGNVKGFMIVQVADNANKSIFNTKAIVQ